MWGSLYTTSLFMIQNDTSTLLYKIPSMRRNTFVHVSTNIRWSVIKITVKCLVYIEGKKHLCISREKNNSVYLEWKTNSIWIKGNKQMYSLHVVKEKPLPQELNILLWTHLYLHVSDPDFHLFVDKQLYKTHTLYTGAYKIEK